MFLASTTSESAGTFVGGLLQVAARRDDRTCCWQRALPASERMSREGWSAEGASLPSDSSLVSCGEHFLTYAVDVPGMQCALRVPRVLLEGGGGVDYDACVPHVRSALSKEAALMVTRPHACILPCLVQPCGALVCGGAGVLTPLGVCTLHAHVHGGGGSGAARVDLLAAAASLAAAIAHVHEVSPIHVHGDVRASHAVVLPDGRAVLADWGLTRETARRGGPASSSYAAPEVVALGPTSYGDVYAYGLLVCELITGQAPVAGRHGELLAAAAAAALGGSGGSGGGSGGLRGGLLSDLLLIVKACTVENPIARLTARRVSELLRRLLSRRGPVPPLPDAPAGAAASSSDGGSGSRTGEMDAAYWGGGGGSRSSSPAGQPAPPPPSQQQQQQQRPAQRSAGGVADTVSSSVSFGDDAAALVSIPATEAMDVFAALASAVASVDGGGVVTTDAASARADGPVARAAKQVRACRASQTWEHPCDNALCVAVLLCPRYRRSLPIVLVLCTPPERGAVCGGRA